MTFLWCGYEIVKIKPSERKFYAKLAYQDERIYLFTRPDSFIMKIIDENDEEEIEIPGFSTKAFYKLSRSKKPKILDLPEINDIFVNCMKEYIKYLDLLYAHLDSEEYKRYIF